MEEKYKRGFEISGKFISLIRDLLIITAYTIYYVFLLLGAFASLFLVFKLFLMEFAYGLVLFYPLWNVLWNILFVLFWMFFGSLVVYAIIRFGFLLCDVKQKTKERERKKREEFQNELVDKIIKKLNLWSKKK